MLCLVPALCLFFVSEDERVINLTEPEVFGEVIVFQSPSGTLAVIEPENCQLILFDAEGKKIGHFGSKGNGPGQFQTPYGLKWSEGESVFLIFDHSRRISKWDENGQHRGDIKVGSMAAFPNIVQGKLLYSIDSYAGKAGKIPTIWRMDLTEQQRENVFAYENLDKIKVKKTGQVLVAVTMPWDPIARFDVDTKTIVSNWSREKRIIIIDPDTKKTTFFSHQTKAIPLTEDQVSAEFEKIPKEMRDYVRKGVVIPEYWPYVAGLFLAENQFLWVVSPPILGNQSVAVYQHDGSFVSKFPVDFAPKYVVGNTIAGFRITAGDNLMLIRKKIVLIR